MSKINFPKSITDIAQIIGVGSFSNAGDLGWICTRNSYINQWARYKPTSGGGKLNRATRDNNTAEKRLVTYGLAYYNGNELVTNTNVLNERITNTLNLSLAKTFVLKQTNLNYYRLQDFNGYDHNATFNLENNYKCFPDESIANESQHGFFYNRGGVALKFHSLKTSGLNTTPLVYDGSTNYCSLDVEDIIAASLSEDIDFHIGNFKLGIIFVFSNTQTHSQDDLYLFSTGKTINELLNPLTPTTYELKFTKDGNEYTLGRITCGNRDFQFTLGKLTLFEKWKGWTIFSAKEYGHCIARIVLINTESTDIEFYKNPTIYGDVPSFTVYAFSPALLSDNTTVFGMRSGFSIKKALSYENITTKTNRSLDTNRRAGIWLMGDRLNDVQPRCWFDYKESSGQWNWHFNTDYQSKKKRSFAKQCCLTLESENTTYRGAGQYVKFRLHLRGYVCHEFRSKYPNGNSDNSDYLQYFFGDEDIRIHAKGSLTLIPMNKSGLGNCIVHFDYTRDGVHYNDDNTTSSDIKVDITNFSSSNGIEIYGATGNYSSNSPFQHTFGDGSPFTGDKIYNDESNSNFHKCHSSLMNVDTIVSYSSQANKKYILNTAFNDSDKIYIYVQKSAFDSSFTINDFYLNLKYNFDVDNEINDVHEEYLVWTATSEAQIKYVEGYDPDDGDEDND